MAPTTTLTPLDGWALKWRAARQGSNLTVGWIWKLKCSLNISFTHCGLDLVMMVKELENNCCFEEWKKASTWGIFLTSYYKTISIGTSFGRNTFHSYLGSIQVSRRLQRFQRFWTILLYLAQNFVTNPSSLLQETLPNLKLTQSNYQIITFLVIPPSFTIL